MMLFNITLKVFTSLLKI